MKVSDAAPADRRHPEHQARPRPLGRHPAPSQLNQAGHRHRLADAAQARQLSASERSGRGPPRTGTDRAHAVHSRLAAKRRTAPPRTCRTEQGGSAQLLGQGGVLQSPRRDQGSELRAAALSGHRIFIGFHIKKNSQPRLRMPIQAPHRSQEHSVA